MFQEKGRKGLDKLWHTGERWLCDLSSHSVVGLETGARETDRHTVHVV